MASSKSPLQSKEAEVVSPEAAGRSGSLLLRLVWSVLGPAAIGISALVMATRAGGSSVAFEVSLWLSAAASVGARWFDIFRFGGSTSDGRPATARHWRRYAVVLLVCAAAAWGAARAVVGWSS